MNFARISIFGIAACIAGLSLLTVLTIQTARQVAQQETEIDRLLALDQSLEQLAVASQSALIQGSDSGLMQAHRAEAQALMAELQRLGDRHPDAQKAAHRIGIIVDLLGSVLTAGGSGDRSPASLETFAPLDMPARSRIALQQVINQTIALNSELDDALIERKAAISGEIRWIIGLLVGAALCFGLVCVMAFALIHGRIVVPMRSLVTTLEAIRAGDEDARAPMTGNVELSRLARTLNLLLDERRESDEIVGERQRKLESALSELRVTRDRLQRAQRIGNVGSWDFDHQGKQLAWSKQALRIFGVAREELGDTLDDFLFLVHSEDRDRLLKQRAEWLEAGGEFEATYRIVRPDGEVRFVEARAERVTNPDGSLKYSTGTLSDVTGRLRQETKIRQLQQLIEGTEDRCAILDTDYCYQWANRAYAELYCVNPGDLIQRPITDFMEEAYFRAEVEPRFRECLAGEPQRFETEREVHGAGRRNLLVRYYPIDVPGTGHRRIGAVITDLTDIRSAKIELARQSQLLDIAGQAAQFGGWTVDLETGKQVWSDVTAEIHAKPHGYSPSIDEGISFYAPEYRDRILDVFNACVERGEPYDEELQIIDANGKRRWVRTVGQPVRDASGRVVMVQGAFQEISSRKELELESQRLAGRLATMLESVTDGFVALDRDWRYVYVNDEAEHITGKDAGELLGTTLWSQFPGAVGTPIETALRRAMEERRSGTAEEFFEPLDAWFDVRAYPWEDGIAIFFRDVSESHRLLEKLQANERALRESHDQLDAALGTRQALIDSLPAHIALLDAKANVIDVNDQWRHFGEQNANPDPKFGIGMNYLAICESPAGECGESVGKVAAGLRAVLAGERQTFSLEYPCHSPDEKHWFRVMFNRLAADASVPGGAVAMHVDITERKLAEQKLERIAFEDPLTGLLSRNGFVSSFDSMIRSIGWRPGDIVAMLDLVNLRDINDVRGYDAGDELLAQVGGRLQARLPDHGIVGRTGGDEFVVYLPGGDTGTREGRLMKLVEVTAEAFELNGDPVEIRSRISYTELGEVRRNPEELIREAEIALFEVRNDTEGERPWLGFSEEMAKRSHDRIALTNELRHALQHHEFELHLQPKVDLTDGKLISAEALIRWNHPKRGLLPPGVFIPVAEQSRLIGPMGDWVLREACRLLRKWKDANLDIVRISVNVSLVQFQMGDFPDKVQATLDEFGIAPAELSLEITESVFEYHSDLLRAAIHRLHDMGVQLSLDDFGTGYSSLMYLQLYPFDEVKIDRAFVSGLLDNHYSREIVRSVMTMAGALGATVVAEGIESPEISQALLDIGCTTGQGFYYSMPLEAEDFRWLLEQHSSLPLSASAK